MKILVTYCLALVFFSCATVAVIDIGTFKTFEHAFWSEWCYNETHGCPAEHGVEDFNVFNVFNMLTESGTEDIEITCGNIKAFAGCINSWCRPSFRASKYGHLVSMCNLSLQFHIDRERDCWDSEFPEEARRCFNYHYVQRRMTYFYPTPFRAYDRLSIARDCFPNEESNCKYYKSYVLWKLMPQYYDLHVYPEGFQHTDIIYSF